MQKNSKKLLAVLLLTGMAGALQSMENTSSMDTDEPCKFQKYEESMQVEIKRDFTFRQVCGEIAALRNHIDRLLTNYNFRFSEFMSTAISVIEQQQQLRCSFNSDAESQSLKCRVGGGALER